MTHNTRVVLFAISLLSLPVSSFATFPGVNGRVAFVSLRDGNRQIYLVNRNGLLPVNLSNSAFEDVAPKFSPDGSKIVFTRTDLAVPATNLNLMSPDGSGQTQITNGPGRDIDGAWSPDGTRIVFSSERDGDSEIFVMDADGSNVTQLTFNTASDFDPDWSPDGTQLAFTTTIDGPNEIYVMDADGSNLTNLTQNPASDFGASWSPDAAQIAFVRLRDGNYEICVMNRDGSAQMNLTNDPAADYTPTWSPDGTTILFTRAVAGGGSEIYSMTRDGQAQTLFTTAASDPTWEALTPEEAIRSLIADVRSYVSEGVLTPLEGFFLNSTLRLGLVALRFGNVQLAIDSMQAFVNRVDFLVTTGGLSQPQGDTLITSANDILAFLGG